MNGFAENLVKHKFANNFFELLM